LNILVGGKQVAAASYAGRGYFSLYAVRNAKHFRFSLMLSVIYNILPRLKYLPTVLADVLETNLPYLMSRKIRNPSPPT
jgi:hypothetical protein